MTDKWVVCGVLNWNRLGYGTVIIAGNRQCLSAALQCNCRVRMWDSSTTAVRNHYMSNAAAWHCCALVGAVLALVFCDSCTQAALSHTGACFANMLRKSCRVGHVLAHAEEGEHMLEAISSSV